MLCPNCGAQLADDMLFCPDCGSPVSRQQSPEPEAVRAPAEAPLQQPTWEQPQQPTWVQPQQPAWEQPQQPMWAQPQPMWAQPQPQAWVQPQAPAVKAPKTKVRHEKPGAGVKVLCIFLCLLLFLTGLYAALLGTVRLTLTEGNIEAMMDEYDAGELTMPSSIDGEPVSLKEFMEETGEVNFKRDYGFSEKELTKLLNKNFVRDFLAETLTAYADGLLRGKSSGYLSRDKLLDFYEEHDKEIFEITGYSFLNKAEAYGDYVYYNENIPIDTSEVDAIFDDLGTDKVSWKWLCKEAGVSFDLISTLLSFLVLLGVIVLAAVLIALIFLANRKTIYSAYTFTGVTAVILGGLLALIAGAGLVYAAISKISVIKLVANPFALRLLLIGGAILALGILLLTVCKGVCNSIARKKQAAAGEPAQN